MSRRFTSSMSEFNKGVSKEPLKLSGRLGIPLGGKNLVEVPGRNSFVYVRLRDNQNELIQAFNNQVAQSYDLAVIVVREGNRYTVQGVDTRRYESNWPNSSSYIPKHGTSHSFDPDNGGGGDLVWVFPRQFMPMLTIPSGSSGGPNVVISPYTLKDPAGNWKAIGSTGTPNLTIYNPTGSYGVMVLVYVDATTGNPGFIVGSGSYFPATHTGTSDIVQYIPTFGNNPNYLVDSAIRLVSGTMVIGWDNIYDVRQFVSFIPTGTPGTGGGGTGSTIIARTGVEAWDEGVPLGTGAVFNFTGPRVSATISGTVVNVNISPDPIDNIGVFVQDEGIPKGTGTVLNFVGVNVDVSVSGTVARVFITGSTGGGGIPSGTIQIFNSGTFMGSADKLNFQYPLAVGFTGTMAYPYLNGFLISQEDVSAQITGSNAHFTLTGTIAQGTSRLYYNGLRQQIVTHYLIDANSKGFTTLFTGTFGDVLIMEYGNAGVTPQTPGAIDIYDGGVLKGSVHAISFDNGLDASIDANNVAHISGSNASPATSGDMTMLQDILLASATGSFVFTGIPQTYKHLLVLASLRSPKNTASAEGPIVLQLNGDSSAGNYWSFSNLVLISGSAGVMSQGTETNADNGLGQFPCGVSISGSFSTDEIRLNDYTSIGKLMTVRRHGSMLFDGTSLIGSYSSYEYSVMWKTFAAVNAIKFLANSGTGTFAAGSRMTLYGLK